MKQLRTRIDTDLETQNVRLTMGGEPTFVGIDDPESPEWNLDALGPMKRSRGLSLIQYLRERVAPGALLHYGQGKWYPGEPLPRWALSCLWRVDGVPVWENIDLIARGDENSQFGAPDALAVYGSTYASAAGAFGKHTAGLQRGLSSSPSATFFPFAGGRSARSCSGPASFGLSGLSGCC